MEKHAMATKKASKKSAPKKAAAPAKKEKSTAKKPVKQAQKPKTEKKVVPTKPAAKAKQETARPVQPVVKPEVKTAATPSAKPIQPAKSAPAAKPAAVVKPVPAPVSVVPPDPNCPCGSKKLYVDCCEPIIKGTRTAQTAEELMRSRYTAYAKAEVQHILASSHPKLRSTLDENATRTWAKNSQWHKLEVVSIEKGGAEDAEGVVEFISMYSEKGQHRSLHERAKFVKEEGRWYYLDGEIVPPKPYVRETPKIGRNDPCPCGSGKKYKKCCGLGK
jgi:SEC-C motif-containing protein